VGLAILRFGPVLVGLSACAGKPERPNLAADCDPAVMNCAVPPGVIGGGSAGGSANADAGPDAGDGILRGRVTRYRDAQFEPSVTAVYAQAAIVEGDGVSGRAQAAWDGMTPFSLGPLAPRTENWLSVDPVLTDDDALRTLYPFDTTGTPSEVELALVRPSSLDLIFSVVTLPIERLPDRGHAVIFVKDAAREPIAGVRIAQSESELVAYAVGGSFSDTEQDFTDETGLVVLGNVLAEDYPTGSLRQVVLSGAVTGRAELKVVRNGVTVAEILAEP
jgi:hypothetical protein